jgi:transketolase C-terminal domain/subunit
MQYTLAGYTAGGVTHAAVGDLVAQDTTASYSVKLAADNAFPLGVVRWVDTVNGIVSIEVLRYRQVVKLKYAGTIALGNDILTHGVDGDVDGTGAGTDSCVIAKDLESGYVEALV